MKIQCDVCGRDEASVFCCADEAALCAACDRRVHRANKLAGKHRRFPLSIADQTHHPLCDICKERRGLVFCQEDRAILCRDCDHPIHSANDLTMKHNRFLLTGVRLLPAASALPPAPQESSTIISHQLQLESNNNLSSNQKKSSSSSVTSSSSISDYLIKTLPGYRVEDFLVDDDTDELCKQDEMVPYLESGGDLRGAAEDQFPIWAPPHVPQQSFLPSSDFFNVDLINNNCTTTTTNPYSLNKGLMINHHHHQNQHPHGLVKMNVTTTTLREQQKQRCDDSLTVPQVNFSSSVLNRGRGSSKRARPSTSTAWDF